MFEFEEDIFGIKDIDTEINSSNLYQNLNKLFFDEEEKNLDNILNLENKNFGLNNIDYFLKETSPETDILGKKIEREENNLEDNINKEMKIDLINNLNKESKNISSVKEIDFIEHFLEKEYINIYINYQRKKEVY